MEKQIGNFTVTAREWVKESQKRIYFTLSNRGGGACWDVNAREWVKVKGEVGVAFKISIKQAFGL